MSTPAQNPERFEGVPECAVEQSLGRRFATVAARWPDRIAVDAGHTCSTYAELAAAADRVAQHVRSIPGPKPLRVGFIFEQPLSLLPSIFGVLQAGAVYVPIDPSFPAARIAAILKDAGVGLLLCDDRTHAFARNLDAGAHPVTNVDSLEATPASESNQEIVAPDAIASIFYTSGSTGEPKGVIQNHRNLIHYARCYIDTLRMRPSDRVSLLFSYSFSGSIPDIFGALLCGATLCPFDVRRRGPMALARWVEDDDITLLHLVPSLYRHLVEQVDSKQSFPLLRAIDLGGEGVTASDVAAFRRYFSKQSMLVHRLAATESSLISRHIIDYDADVPDGVIPVGSPVEGMQIRITGPDGEALESGQVGEIELQSRYLSPGYWQKPELTAALFSEEPASQGVRRYRSGDRGRQREDGLIEHLGRLDQRVKVRGFTVETAEIEAALRAIASVRECAVVAHASEGRDTSLVAFVQTRSGETLSESGLRRELRNSLPEYALPARLQRVDALPLTATGKIDRRRLEQTVLPPPSAEKEPVAPRDAIEASLASIWCSELGLESVGVCDDYFALGGTSLQAVQIMARIEEQFGRDLTPSILLETPTVAELAVLIHRDEFPETGSLVVALKPDGARPPLFCFPGIGGEPIIFKAFVRRMSEDQPCYGVQTPGLVGHRRPPRRVDEHVGPQLEAIREVQPRGPYFFAGYSFGSTVAFEAARRLRAEGEHVELLALIDGWAPGHPRLLPEVSRFHRFLDRWLGSTLKENQRVRPRTLIFQFLKMRGRDLECRLRELSGRSLTRVQRKRRHKRAAVRARNRYKPDPVDAPILLIRSSSPVGDTIFDRDPLRGWRAFSTQSVELREAPGKHTALMDEPNVIAVAAAVTEALDAAHVRSDGDRAISNPAAP